MGAYVKIEGISELSISISQKRNTLAVISTKDIEYSVNSNWKFVRLDFILGIKHKDIRLEIIKTGNGEAYVDDVGIIPIPE